MTLNECRVCRELISPKAKICCHCGASDPRGRQRKRGVVLTLIVGLLTLGVYLAMDSVG